MRILAAMLKHETNTFSPVPTDLARFRAWGLYEGEAVPAAYRGTNHPLAAYLDLAEAHGAEIVTPVAAEAMPSGLVQREAYEYLTGLILEELARGGFDCAMLDLHGAMVAEPDWDGEGGLLEAMRRIAPDLPIAVTLDMHGNITERVVENCTVLVGYKTYPHLDMAEMGRRAGTILLDAMAGRCRPVMAYGRLPLLAQTLRMGTADHPMGPLQAMTKDEEARPGILAASVFGGFPMADIPVAGLSAIVVADGDEAAARSSRDRLLAWAWEEREEFVYRHEPIGAAIARAKGINDAPIVLLDHADNVGSGGTSDSMVVIRELIAQNVEDVAVAAVWDPPAVQAMIAAGPGATLTLDLGGRTEMPSIGARPEPLRVTGVVRSVSDGEWIVRGPMYTGTRVTTGPTAVFETAGIRIVVTTHHHEPWDAGIFTNNGIDPRHCRYLLLKSRIHYRAGFAALAKAHITLDGVGVTTSDNAILRFDRLERPIYPLDPDAAWSP
ncbi:M81 family metallopeptidase [Salinarimonas soli]|uniref:Microcystinase C n=2 Tax=Salinarimonas soli TaxID=1638099 RepID=A0A5B2VS93_9HYPH|nr:M81 family metallopeptidase [Salinarimonas soli]